MLRKKDAGEEKGGPPLFPRKREYKALHCSLCYAIDCYHDDVQGVGLREEGEKLTMPIGIVY